MFFRRAEKLFAESEAEAAATPAVTKFTEKPVLKTNYKFTMSVSPLDCMGCTLCVKACPVNNNAKLGTAIEMKPIVTQLDQQEAYNYAVKSVSEKPELIGTSIKGSQFKQPLLEYSGSCAGCAETSYARLVTQLFGERMYISNATGCSSIWGGSAPATPYTVNNESGRGPAWGNSLFEDNAEHGLGMFVGQNVIRDRLIAKVEEMAQSDKASDAFKAAVAEYIATKDNGAKNEAATAVAKVSGTRADLVDFVNDIVVPVGAMKGDSLSVSAFMKYVDGAFPQGSAAYEKRGVAVTVPQWNPENCIQCNNCAFVCPHACIRPFAMTEAEAAAAPAVTKFTEKPVIKTNYKFTMSVSPLDCMGCTLCVKACPVNNNAKLGTAIEMKPIASQLDQQEAYNYAVANVSEKPELIAATIKGSQFKQPLLEYSGSCAGCAETSYARLVTQLFGERMFISNATGCSSIWGGSAPATPYTVNNKSGRGPAWGNSLFEDNAEHGLGMYIGQKAVRDRLISKVEEMAKSEKASDAFKAAAEQYLATKDDGSKNEAATAALVAELEAAAKAGCPAAPAILKDKKFLSKKSVWLFGGDGWAYDIGFGGLDHVLASGEDVNVMVFDTEVYSNTGGQASKASNIGQVAQFAAAGKAIGKKNLAEIAMSYGYVYVAQVAMGADMNQTLKAISEAEAYPGPSLIICYAPCEMHSIKGGMANCQAEMKKAVEAGYWQMFRFNPALKAEGKNPFSLDSKEPTGDYQAFLGGEARYTRLAQAFPERAEKLFSESEAAAKAKYERLKKFVEFYNN